MFFIYRNMIFIQFISTLTSNLNELCKLKCKNLKEWFQKKRDKWGFVSKFVLTHTPCWSVLVFWNIHLGIFSSSNWIFTACVIKLELKWNFHFLKLKILKWKNYPVTLDISKNQWRSSGGVIPLSSYKCFDFLWQ